VTPAPDYDLRRKVALLGLLVCIGWLAVIGGIAVIAAFIHLLTN
jgi:hypothetical protein